MRNLKPVLMTAVLSVFFVLLSGCGKNSKLVRHSEVKTFEENGTVYAQWLTQLDLGNLRMPSLSIPIVDPKNQNVWLGDLSLRAGLKGTTELAVTLDTSALLTLPGGPDGAQALLPNGSVIPVGGLGETPVVAMKAGSRSRVYAAIGTDVLMLGVAVVIREFDGIGKNIPIPINLFPFFQIQDGVTGVAGIFTSNQPEQSGLAVFVDAGEAVFRRVEQKRVLASSIRSGGSDRRLMAMVAPSEVVSEPRSIFFTADRVSRRDEKRVMRSLYNLNRRKARLHVR